MMKKSIGWDNDLMGMLMGKTMAIVKNLTINIRALPHAPTSQGVGLSAPSPARAQPGAMRAFRYYP